MRPQVRSGHHILAAVAPLLPLHATHPLLVLRPEREGAVTLDDGLKHIGSAADALSSNTHKLLAYCALVYRDLKHGDVVIGDGGRLLAGARAVRERAAHLGGASGQLAAGPEPPGARG